MTNTRRSDRGFIGTLALVFAVSAAVTVLWSGSMTSMSGMEMPGGWTMSMAWMRMPGQSWFGAAATFIGMWTTMMIAMMLPSLVPALARFRRATGSRGRLTAIFAAGYFTVWTMSGVIAFPFGVVLAELAMRLPAIARGVPVATGVVVLIAGAVQFSAWKARQLACCREAPLRTPPAAGTKAFRHGLRLGIHCVCCCAGPTAVLFVMGVMDLRAMALVTIAIIAERRFPAGDRVERSVGVLTVAGGLILVVRALI